MVKIAIVYYSLYGHIRTLAESVKAGVEEAGAEAFLFQVAETLPEEVLTKMHAPPKSDDPIITAAELADYDGIIFGVSTRFGSVSAQMRAFFDSTGQLWQKGALVGKPVATFQSTASAGGGQETSALTGVIPFAVHHGMIFVPLGFRDPAVFSLDEVRGASAYGAGTLAGHGTRQPSDLEKGVAKTQGKSFAEVAAKLAK